MDNEEKEEDEFVARTLQKCERGLGQVVKSNKKKSKQTNTQTKKKKKNPKKIVSLNYEQVRGQEGWGGQSGPSSST